MVKKINKKTVLVSISGGVDSCATVIILLTKNYFVNCIFIKNFYKKKNLFNNCKQKNNIKDVTNICLNFNLNFYIYDIYPNYKKKILDPFINNYKSGITPNPDILCNKLIKFPLLQTQRKKLNIENIATGHYAKLKKKNLYIPIDTEKDQVYFLYSIKRLKNIIFPLGDYYKKQIRKIIFLTKKKYINSKKKSSTGICFIEQKKFKYFLLNFIKKKTGLILLKSKKNNKNLGQHIGTSFYTIGEHINTTNNEKKYFVVKKNIKKNILYVSEKKNLLKKKEKKYIKFKKTYWCNKKNNGIFYTKVKYRNYQKHINCIIFSFKKKNICIFLSMHLLASGQYIICYTKYVCLGGGPIIK